MRSKMISWLRSHLVKDQGQPKPINPDENIPKLARLSKAIAKASRFLHKDAIENVEANQLLMARNLHRTGVLDGVEVDPRSEARDWVGTHQVNTSIPEEGSILCQKSPQALTSGDGVARYGDVFNNLADSDKDHAAIIGLEPSSIVDTISANDNESPDSLNSSGTKTDFPVIATRNPKIPIHLRDLSKSTAESSSYSPVTQGPSSSNSSLESTTKFSAFDIFEPRDPQTAKEGYVREQLNEVKSHTLGEANHARFIPFTNGESDQVSVCTVVVNGEAGREQISGLRRRQASKDLHTLFVAKLDHAEDTPSSDKDHLSAVPCMPAQEEETAIPEPKFNAMLEEIKSAYAMQIADLKEEHQDASSQLISNSTRVKTAISGLRQISGQMQQRFRDEVNAKEIAERRCQELGEQLKFKDSQIEGITSALQARQVSYDELMSRYTAEIKVSQENEQTVAVKEQMIAALNTENAAKDQEIASKDQEIVAKQQAVVSKDEKIFELDIEIDELSEQLSQKKAYTKLEKQADIITDLQKENRRLREDKLKSILGCKANATPKNTILETTVAERDHLQKRFDAEQVKNHLLGVAAAKARDEAFFYSIRANVNAQAFEENQSTPCSVTDLLKLREKQIHD
ncbi:MAG: hypothetical protein Q9187_004680, partial [Circinaria calcarea]